MDRIVHTGLKMKAARDICNAIIGQMSDGYWENSPRMVKYWLFVKTDVASDGEVVFKIDSRYAMDWCRKHVHNAFLNMRNSQVLEFFQKKIKFIVGKELKESGMTLRNADDSIQTIWLAYQDDITVKDVKEVIRTLQAASISSGLAEAAVD